MYNVVVQSIKVRSSSRLVVADSQFTLLISSSLLPLNIMHVAVDGAR
jgi:hypothetical protein